MRRPERPGAGRWPWGTTAVAAVAGGSPWWTAVPRPDRPGGARTAGPAVPVSGPAALDTDGDGRPDVLVVDLPDGPVLWADLDGDGLADDVTVTGWPADPAAGFR